MKIGYIKLTEKHYEKVWDIFLEGFIDNHYFTDILPEEKDRLKMFDEVYVPAVRYCIEEGTSYAITVDGEIAGYNLIAHYSDKTMESFEKIFFEPFIAAGEAPVERLREYFRETKEKYPEIAYFLIGVVMKKYRGLGIGKKINKYVTDVNENRPIIAELTSDGIIAIYDKIAGDREVIKEAVSDSYIITTLLPKAE